MPEVFRELGWRAADFDLPAANPDVDREGGPRRTLADYSAARVVVIVFTCNHCPYAKHVEPELVRVATDYLGRGVQLLAICSNDAAAYPADSFDAMKVRALAVPFPFPYLHDETQRVAREYGAICTPDTFVFDEDRALRFRGRIDETRPGKGEPSGRELRAALDALISRKPVAGDQAPSVGCSMKWRLEQN